MLTMTAGAVAGSLVLSMLPVQPDSAGPIVAMLGVTGGLINAVQTTMYALAANVYPTAVRATGVGAAVSFGRTGAVLSTYTGAWALEAGGSARVLRLMAGALHDRLPLARPGPSSRSSLLIPKPQAPGPRSQIV